LVKEIRSPRVGFAVIVLMGIGVLLTPRFYWVRLGDLTDLAEAVRNDWSFYIRFEAMREAWKTFLEHPLTGVGLSNFPLRSAREVFVRIGPHNMYLGLLADLGIFGLLAYLGVHYAAFREFVASMRAKWQEGYEWLADFSYYLALTLVTALMAGLFMDCEFTYLLWIPVAGALALQNVRTRFSA